MVMRAQRFTFDPGEGTAWVDHAWRQIRPLIVSGELAPGTRLTQLDLAVQMGMSQGSVREALQRLEQDGLVERRARTGTFLTSISHEEMYEVFSVRSVVESIAIRRTVKRITPGQLDELSALVELMRTAGQARDMLALSDYDLRFHMHICKWSMHSMLLRVWLPLYTQIQRFIVQTHSHYFRDLVEIANTHGPILDALRDGHADNAAARIEAHIMLIWSQIQAEEMRS